MRSPEQPTQAEIDEHEVHHLPYRAWCRFCVIGRGKATPHFQHGEEDIGVPTICTDYGFIGKKVEVEEADESTVPFLAHRRASQRSMDHRVACAAQGA